MWLKGVVMRAHFNGLIPRNPFAQFHISPNVKEREFLTEEGWKAEREELQQRISTLESQNEELVRHIETMEREYKEERTKFNEYMDKIQQYFPYMEKLLPLIDFSRNTLNFSERLIQELCKLKKVRLKGDFYSPEFNRKFRDENAAFSFEEDKNRKGHYHICVNDIPLVQWFRQKAHEWRNGFGITPTSTRLDKGLKI